MSTKPHSPIAFLLCCTVDQTSTGTVYGHLCLQVPLSWALKMPETHLSLYLIDLDGRLHPKLSGYSFI